MAQLNCTCYFESHPTESALLINRFRAPLLQRNFRVAQIKTSLYCNAHKDTVYLPFVWFYLVAYFTHPHSRVCSRNSNRYHWHTVSLFTFLPPKICSSPQTVYVCATDIGRELESTLHMCASCRGR